MNWCGASFATDTYGKGLLAAGVDAKTLAAWSDDPQVALPGGGKGWERRGFRGARRGEDARGGRSRRGRGRSNSTHTTGSLFDALEDMDSDDCLVKAVAIKAAN